MDVAAAADAADASKKPASKKKMSAADMRDLLKKVKNRGKERKEAGPKKKPGVNRVRARYYVLKTWFLSPFYIPFQTGVNKQGFGSALSVADIENDNSVIKSKKCNNSCHCCDMTCAEIRDDCDDPRFHKLYVFLSKEISFSTG